VFETDDGKGAMFPLKPTKRTEVKYYDIGKWGYPTSRKTFKTKEEAVEALENLDPIQ
jgi:hypothetical protein